MTTQSSFIGKDKFQDSETITINSFLSSYEHPEETTYEDFAQWIVDREFSFLSEEHQVKFLKYMTGRYMRTFQEIKSKMK